MTNNPKHSLLEVEDLHVSYGRLIALQGISLHVMEGEIVCLVGPNGAGKSTALCAIAGGVPAQRGEVRLDGRKISGKSPDQIARLRVSLVLEGRHVFATLSVEENLRIATFMRRDTTAAATELERTAADFPRLRERWRSPAGYLSGGEQQMLVIARALLTRPRLMMIDEPSLGLAPRIVDQVYELLLDLRRRDGLTLLINEQSSQRLLQFADRIYVIRNGVIRLHDLAANLQDGQAIRQAYFGFSRTNGRVAATLS